mgnify:CR=1 FL=1
MTAPASMAAATMAGIKHRDVLRTICNDTARRVMHMTRRSAALLGLATAATALALTAHPDLRQQGEQTLLGWLQQRQEASAEETIAAEPMAADRATAALPHTLPTQQAKVAQWLSRKYRVAQEPLSVLVAEAYEISHIVKIDPTLILAVMAIESRFNPFAQSPVGAQGLMQVMTRVHTDKYRAFGGQLAAFDPVANLRVGARVLQECIQRAGSVEGGLRLYVGAVTTSGADYINKVMAEHLRIQSVAQGKPMPTRFPVYRPEPAPAVPPATMDEATTQQEALTPFPPAEAAAQQEALAPFPPAEAPAPAASPLQS